VEFSFSSPGNYRGGGGEGGGRWRSEKEGEGESGELRTFRSDSFHDPDESLSMSSNIKIYII